jgi:ABC-2 type transport system permease protein
MSQALPRMPAPPPDAGRASRAPRAGSRAPSRGRGKSLRDALRAEWTKARTMPGTFWLLGALIVATVGVSAAAAAATRCPAGPACPVDTAKLTLTGVQFGQAIAAILAVLVIGGEYSTGMIRATLAAMPRRTTVLAAKGVVVTALVLAAGTIAVAGSLLAGALILPGHGFSAARGFPVLSLADGPVLRAAAGSVLYLCLVTLLALGVAAAVRDTAAAIGAVLGLLYLFPIVAAVAANSQWQRHLQQAGPMTAGLEIQATRSLHSLPISPWAGLGVLAAWAAAAVLAGGLRLRFRDA